MVIFVDPWHSHCYLAFGSEAVTTCFCRGWDSNTTTMVRDVVLITSNTCNQWRRLLYNSAINIGVFFNICLCFVHIIHYNNTMNTFCSHWSSRKYWFTFKYLATFKMIILLSFFFRMRYVYLQERVKNTVSTLEARFFSKTTYDRV